MGTPEDAGEDPQGTSQSHELLACVSCRSRKLKCDRRKPACTRCAKVKSECVYPESRRKPALKRRNVKELEERLAKVEGLLNEARNAGRASGSGSSGDADGLDAQGVSPDDDMADTGAMFFGSGFDFDESFVSNLLNGDMPPVPPARPGASHGPAFEAAPEGRQGPQFDPLSPGELVGLGQFEALPPFEMIEELHEAYFQRQQHFIPIIHKARYLKAFYSPPHMRPPMCLQYAIWTMATAGHEKYAAYQDVFYRRTRRYLEEDELKGYGEQFMSISHVQAWALTATIEARCMYFTRAGMSSARCVRLIHMMGLHRLDDQSETERPMLPTIPPAQSWVEQEERRRCLWGAFCIDSHASISTGWPNLVDIDEVTTRLPSSEEAFNGGREETAPTLQEALNGAGFSSFASSAIVCFIFVRVLKHIHRPTPNDRPDDIDHGAFWKRHREIDNTLSSIFMFLPERFRLPKNIRDPTAVNCNLNLHASVICLHNAACDKVEVHNLPPQVKRVSLDRAVTAAQEIVNIMRLTSHLNSPYKTPMAALSLYCAASVFVHQAKDDPASFEAENLEFMITCMQAIGKDHLITKAFLEQIISDVERHNLGGALKIPLSAMKPANMHFQNIPLLARSSISSGELRSPIERRPPMGKSWGCGVILENQPAGVEVGDSSTDTSPETNPASSLGVPGAKRKRTAASETPSSGSSLSGGASAPRQWSSRGPAIPVATAAILSQPPDFHTRTGTAVVGEASAMGASSSFWSTSGGRAQAGGMGIPQMPGGAPWGSFAAELPNRSGSPYAAPVTAPTATHSGPGPTLLGGDPGVGVMASGSQAGGSASASAQAYRQRQAQQPPDEQMQVLDMFQDLLEGQWGLTDPPSIYAHVSGLLNKARTDFGGVVENHQWDVTPEGGEGAEEGQRRR
ncbi:hypothetical protein VTK73DRAFT_4011 [Phialemonium thermophilum]|uniref:Zn(2)-C6 fungal-type domain-containing protein n=1 Tax=Phialemonium thermophilum TaxID=223376 RepID=A0ABR3WW83_9PEZI